MFPHRMATSSRADHLPPLRCEVAGCSYQTPGPATQLQHQLTALQLHLQMVHPHQPAPTPAPGMSDTQVQVHPILSLHYL